MWLNKLFSNESLNIAKFFNLPINFITIISTLLSQILFTLRGINIFKI